VETYKPQLPTKLCSIFTVKTKSKSCPFIHFFTFIGFFTPKKKIAFFSEGRGKERLEKQRQKQGRWRQREKERKKNLR